MTSSSDSAIIVLHFLQVSVLSGSYIGINILAFGPLVDCSMKSKRKVVFSSGIARALEH